jgi:hypothetical protein
MNRGLDPGRGIGIDEVFIYIYIYIYLLTAAKPRGFYNFFGVF